MKIQHISKYIFSIGIVFISIGSTAQVKSESKLETTIIKKDTIAPKKERYGLRVGIDLYKLTRSFYEKNYRGLELTGDYKLTRKHFLAAEIGNEDKTVNDARLNFTTKGNYIKIGLDYNTFDNWGSMENMIYGGFRYGFSTFNQTLNSYKIYNTSSYFGEIPLQSSGEVYKGLSAQWLELVTGIKAQVFKNVFIGFSFRLNYLISQKLPYNFDNLYIPGFNRTYNGNFGIGFNYSVSYFIPLYKFTIKSKDKAEKKKNKKK